MDNDKCPGCNAEIKSKGAFGRIEYVCGSIFDEKCSRFPIEQSVGCKSRQISNLQALLGEVEELLEVVAKGKCCEMVKVANGETKIPRQYKKAQALLVKIRAKGN